MAVNKVILVGNVGKDPETRYLDENTPVCKFPLATSEVYRNREGEKVEQTEWHNIVLWRGLARVAEQYVKKGSQLYIEGRIRSRSYDDRDGNKRYITEIIGDNMQMLGRRQDSDQDGYGGGQTGGEQQGNNYQGSAQQGGQAAQGSGGTGTSQQGAQPAGNQGASQQGAPQQGSQQPSAQPGSAPQQGGSQQGNNQQDRSAGNTDPGFSGPGDEPDDLPF